jgi:hypothetical protein
VQELVQAMTALRVIGDESTHLIDQLSELGIARKVSAKLSNEHFFDEDAARALRIPV